MSALRSDIPAYRSRRRFTLALSIGSHVLVFLWLSLYRQSVAEENLVITEIEFIEPEEPAPAAPAEPVETPAKELSAVTSPHPEEVRFRRQEKPAEVVPDPQEKSAYEDRLSARLDALTQREPLKVAGVAATKTPLRWPTPAAPAGGRDDGAPVALTRGTGPKTPALELTRGKRASRAPKLAVASVPTEKAVHAGPAETTDSNARRTLAGATLVGPIANRSVLSHPTPAYPEWAKREGVEGTVTLYFVVLANGRVKENVVVQKTAGYADFDESARAAILAWRFKPLPAGSSGEQWGTITFHFRLNSVRG